MRSLMIVSLIMLALFVSVSALTAGVNSASVRVPTVMTPGS